MEPTLTTETSNPASRRRRAARTTASRSLPAIARIASMLRQSYEPPAWVMTPATLARLDPSARAISTISGLSGLRPARWPSQSISINTGRMQSPDPTAAAIACAVSRLSSTIARCTPLFTSASARASLPGAKATPYRMSRYPWAANSSASFRVDTVIGPGVSPWTRRVTSRDFAVFTCRRSFEPSDSTCDRILAAFTSTLPRSSSRAGVSSSDRVVGSFIFRLSIQSQLH